MRVDLDLTLLEYMLFKKKYPILKDKDRYYFETSNPYISNGFGLCVGLPVELEKYILYDEEEDEASE
jgi:hypothetical protein